MNKTIDAGPDLRAFVIATINAVGDTASKTEAIEAIERAWPASLTIALSKQAEVISLYAAAVEKEQDALRTQLATKTEDSERPRAGVDDGMSGPSGQIDRLNTEVANLRAQLATLTAEREKE